MVQQALEIGFEFRNQRWRNAEAGLAQVGRITRKDFQRQGPVLNRELREYLNAVATALSRRHGGSWPSGTSPAGARPGTLSRRSGSLLRAISRSVEVRGTRVDSIVGTIGAPGLPYGRIQEEGGVVRAKRAKYLTIPLPAALNRDGTPRRRRARSWKNTFVRRSKAGNLVIFQKRGQEVVPLYLLKPSVRIPPRLGMAATLEAGLSALVDDAMAAMARSIVTGGRTAG